MKKIGISEMMKKREGLIPTRNTTDELYGVDVNLDHIHEKRLEAVRQFILLGKYPEPIFDTGTRNTVRDHLRKNGFKIQHFEEYLDYDIDHFDKRYTKSIGTIFCFETIEHLFNPLFTLLEFKRMLKDDGRVYLSIPLRPHFLWDFRHYYEMDDKRLGWLLDRAGFEIVRCERFYFRDSWWVHLRGIRPIIRWFISYTRLIELKKK